MKRKQILAKAITLGLLLAMPCSAWAEDVSEYKFSGSKTLTQNTTYTGGLLVKEGASIEGNKQSLDIRGYFFTRYRNSFNDTLSEEELYTSSSSYLYKDNPVGLANLGSITGVSVLKFSPAYGGLVNQGIITAATLDLTEYVSALSSPDYVHNDFGGKMTVDNIEGNLNTSGTKYYQTTLINDGRLTVNNSIKTNVINNTSGVITYKGTEAISGTLQNSGTVIVPSGNLKIADGRLTIWGNSSQFLDKNGNNLQSLEIVNDGIDIGSSLQDGSLVVDGTIKTNSINNYGNLQASALDINGVETVGYGYLAGTNYAGAAISVSNSINIANNASFENESKIFFSKNEAVITGNGIINNLYPDSIIAKNADGDKITKLTIKGTLNNSGIVAAETLNAAKGMDAADSKGFNVDKLNILDEGSFALNGSEYYFTSVGVGKSAALTASGTLTVSGAMTLQEGASVETLADGSSISAGSLSVGDGGSITTGAITVSKNELEDGTITTGFVTTGANSIITADTLSAAGDVSIGGTANISTSINAGTLAVGDGGSIRANINIDGNATAVPTIDVQNNIILGANADVTAGTIASTNGSLEIGDGSSVTVDALNLNGNASEGKGTITLGGVADGTKKAAALNVANGITANALTSDAGSVITVGAGKNIEIAGALDLGGAAGANKITAVTLTTGAGSELTANTLGVTSAVIGGQATVTEMTAAGSVDVNASGSLFADIVNVTNAMKIDGIADVGSVEAALLTNNGTLKAKGDVTAAKTLTNSGMLTGDSIEAVTLLNDGVMEASGNVKANGALTNYGALNGANVEAVTLTNSSKLTAKGNVTVAGKLDNSGTLTGANVEAETLANSSKLTATGDVTVAGKLTNDGTLEAKNISAKSLEAQSGTLTATNTLTVTDVVNVGKNASVEAKQSGLAARAITNDGQLTTAGSIIASGALSNSGTLNSNGNDVKAETLTNSGVLNGANVEAEMLANSSELTATGDVTVAGKLTNSGMLTGDDVEAETLLNDGVMEASGNVKANGALTNNGTLSGVDVKAETLANSSKLTATGDVTIAGELTSTGTLEAKNISANSLEAQSGTLTAKDSLTVADAVNVGTSASVNVAKEMSAILMNIDGAVEAASVAATTLVTGVNSKLKAQALGVTSAEINGEAIVNDAMTAKGIVAVNEGAALTAGSVTAAELDVEGSLFTDVVKVEDVMRVSKGAEVEVTESLKADILINSGNLTSASADTAALTNRGTLNIGNVKTDILTNSGTADIGALKINEQGVVNANGGSLIADTITANQAIINANGGTLQAGTLTSNNSTIVTNGGTLTANTIVADNLKINALTNTYKQVIANELQSDNLTVNVDGLTPEQVVIGDYTGKKVAINGSSNVTDSFDSNDFTSIEAGMQDLADTVNTGAVVKELTSAAGSVLGEFKGTLTADGVLTITGEGVNRFNQGISEMASIAMMTWRQENNDMNKRLGELRDSAGEHGVWVRMTRGESKYGAQNIKNQYNSYQLGYDEKLSVDKKWTVGAALTYTNADSSFSGGKGENKHKGLAIYGSRLNDDGSFIDLIARYARLEHDFDVRGGAGKGDFDSNGYSLSAEYGKRFTQKSGLWFEPQIELTYGWVGSAEYITDKRVMVRQESMDSLVGRLGFALGQNLAKGKGNVYLRASYLYDFDGETDVLFANPTQNRRFKQNLGGGWWEVGVGANVNIGKASHLYFDVEKTYGGNVAAPWQWNAGLRWSF